MNVTRVRPLAALVATVFAISLAPADAAQARTGKDQVVLSGSVDIGPGETVGTVVSVDGPVDVAGHVTGDLVAINGPVRISGRVDGNVTLVSQRGVLAPGAVVGGDVLYGDEKPVIASGARVAGKVSNENWSDLASPSFGIVLHVAIWIAVSLSSLLLGLALLGFAPRAADRALDTARERLGVAAAWGAGLFVGLPLVAIFAVATLLALPLGLALLCALLPLAAVGYVTSAWLLGNLMRKPGGGGRIPIFLLGWVVLRVLALVPFIGAIAWLAATAIGLGVLAVASWRHGHEQGVASPVAMSPPTPAATV